MSKQVKDIHGYVEDLLKIESDGIGVPGLEEPRTINWISDGNAQFFQDFHTNAQILPEYMAGEWGVDTVSSVALAAEANPGDTTLTITDASDLDNAGGIVIDGEDIVYYTSKSGNLLSGVTGVDYKHVALTSAIKLYQLPSDFSRVRPGRNRGDGVLVGTIPLREDELPSSFEFKVLYNGSNKYLWLSNNTGRVRVYYDKKPTEFTSIEDEIDVPSPHHMYVAYYVLSLWKQIENQDYVPQKEDEEMRRIFNAASMKRSAGKVLRSSNKFFRPRRRYV